MGMYTIPGGLVDELRVNKSAYVTTTLEVDGGSKFDASAAIGNASTDNLALFGDAGSAQQSTPNDAEVTASAVTAATQLNQLLDRLTTSGLLGGT